MVPHGDRGDAAESRRVEDDKHVARSTHDIVGVLVLDNHVEDLEAAVENVLERVEPRDVNERVRSRGRDRSDAT